MTSSGSYYELLGISRSADAYALRKAFHRLSKDLHPDTTALPVDEAAQRFRELCEAYELLSDPLRREAYDKTLDNEISDELELPKSQKLNSKVPSKIKFDAAPRRPFSGGELFALLLLCITLLLSLMLGVGFALLDGRELQVSPSWLKTEQALTVLNPLGIRDANTSSSYNSFKSAFFDIDRTLALRTGGS
ncbi:J domain-containing protein [Prochlorococcus marinus]|uniref:DnaJ-like protein n=1 Tax=Prochlorococcus marinus (strain MIT 9211) TaxID=93059 RepID=A9BCG3_PROM4|nr:DnaJ domain-containing protein [Prochlorococcus marinus]ABX09525.1 DnaJ-like protein [Prochlorococcus marinus str. MIT 9211]